MTLEVWRLMKGPWFGEPQMMTADAAAETLGVPRAEVTNILQETHAAVSSRVRALQPELAQVGKDLRAKAEELKASAKADDAKQKGHKPKRDS